MKHYYLVSQGDYGSTYEAWEIEQLCKPQIDLWLAGKEWEGYPYETYEPLYDDEDCEDCHYEYIIELDEYVQDTDSTEQPYTLASLDYKDGVYLIDEQKPIERSSCRGTKVWTCITYLGTDDNWERKMNEIRGYSNERLLS